jgi:hypothetical protein
VDLRNIINQYKESQNSDFLIDIAGIFQVFGMWKVVVVDVVCFLYSVCLSETVSIYMKEEGLYIFLLALI